MNRICRTLLMTALAIGGLAACGQSPAGPDLQNLFKGKLVIGAETWPGYLALFVARDKGYYREEGLDVEIKRYITLSELSADYVAGKVHGRANLTLDAVKEHLDGMNHLAVLGIDFSSGSDAIAARGNIRSVRDFAGRRVGFEPGTLEEFFLSWALEKHHLSLSDITKVPAGPSKVAQMLMAGEVDVAVTHEPFLTEVVRSGKGHVVFSSAESPGLIMDILTFPADFINAYPGAVSAVLRAYFKGLQFWKDHPDEACAILAREFGVQPAEIAEQLKGIHMLDERDNQTAFTFAAGVESIYGNMRRIADFVQRQRGKTTLGIGDTNRLVEPAFVRELFIRKTEKSQPAGYQ